MHFASDSLVLLGWPRIHDNRDEVADTKSQKETMPRKYWVHVLTIIKELKFSSIIILYSHTNSFHIDRRFMLIIVQICVIAN